MADKKITALDELLEADIADADLLPIVDLDADSTKKVTFANLKAKIKALFTASDVTDFDTEVSNNTDVAANTTARHTHANKALLDSYTQTDADIADAISKEHTHSNKAVLDATTASYTTAEESKLSGIESGATADQSGAEIKAAYEAEANTNAYTDAEKSKLSGIEANADVTDATNVAAAGAVIPTGTPDGTKFLRDDGAWSAIPAGGDLLAANNLSDLDNASTARTNLGVEIGVDVQAYSSVLANTTASFTTAEETKLSGIESNATADQTGAEIKTALDGELSGTVVGTSDTQTLTNKTIDFDSNTIQNEPVVFALSCSDLTTDLTTGTAVAYFRAPYAFTLTEVRASVLTASTGANIIVDINESGTSVLSTKLSIDTSEKTSTTAGSAAVISDSAIADDAEITIDIDQVGSTVAGAGLIVYLIGKK